MTAGGYYTDAYLQTSASGSPTSADSLIGSGFIDWSGTSEIITSTNNSLITSSHATTDTLMGSASSNIQAGITTAHGTTDTLVGSASAQIQSDIAAIPTNAGTPNIR